MSLEKFSYPIRRGLCGHVKHIVVPNLLLVQCQQTQPMLPIMKGMKSCWPYHAMGKGLILAGRQSILRLSSQPC
eukprot:scaffold269167_cov17-Prasinocladus_malaysianus.AAC.1